MSNISAHASAIFNISIVDNGLQNAPLQLPTTNLDPNVARTRRAIARDCSMLMAPMGSTSAPHREQHDAAIAK